MHGNGTTNGKSKEGNRQNQSINFNFFFVFLFISLSIRRYYLHQFLKEQPDLNYRDASLVQEMKDIIQYWLDQGVSGYRIDAVPYLFESLPDATTGLYKDEKINKDCPDPDEYCHTIHTETQDLDETFDMIFQFRAVIDKHTAQAGDYSR